MIKRKYSMAPGSYAVDGKRNAIVIKKTTNYMAWVK